MRKIGTIYHGLDPAKGNLWIVTQDQTDQLNMLFDGNLKMWCTTPGRKSLASNKLKEATPAELGALATAYGYVPRWALTLMGGGVNVTAAVTQAKLTKPSTVLSAGAIAQVQKTLGISLTPPTDSDSVKVDLEVCPKQGHHKFVLYTGLFSSFYFCEYCDRKRELGSGEIYVNA